MKIIILSNLYFTLVVEGSLFGYKYIFIQLVEEIADTATTWREIRGPGSASTKGCGEKTWEE